MSEQIDWSKAPEGAMVLLKHVRDDSYAWAVSHSEDARAWHKWNIKCSFHLMASEWSVVAERQTTPSWSGEGLPPVGVVCMANGYQVVIVAHHCNGIHAIYAESEYDGLLYYGEPNEFRHIRTPEQIAADEREAALIELIKDAGKSLATGSIEQAAKIYDAGWRKHPKQ